MKLALIAIGLLTTISQVAPAFARGGGIHSEDPWNPQHINGLPAEVRNALARMCGTARAQHQFAGYFQNSRVLVLHFEHFRCGDRRALCTSGLPTSGLCLDRWPLSVVENLLRSRGRLSVDRLLVAQERLSKH